MSASQIPNLLSLRGSRGGRGRGSSRGRGGHLASSSAAHDAIIQGTDTDAAVSRLSAVDVGYLDDPYAQYFVQSLDGPPARRLPIINRGAYSPPCWCSLLSPPLQDFESSVLTSITRLYDNTRYSTGTYTRTAALNTLVDAFLSEDEAVRPGPRQIISLGAGTDTRPFHLFEEGNHKELIYHEVDFEVVSSRKLRTVRGNPHLSRVLTDLSSSEESTTWSSRPAAGGEYYCHGLDLRKLQESSETTVLPGLRTDIPTLVLSECCLCYLSPEEARGVIAFFSSRTPSLAIAIYEPIRPDDPFGQVMISNLASRRIRMPTLSVYPEPVDQANRLTQAGFEVVRHMTIGDIWKTWVAQEEKERLDELEGLDEVEEWQLLAAHYIVVWGSKGDGFGPWNGFSGGGA